ncbi:integrase [Methanomicrobium sp. W14]|uniref:hypothetical protein n=1 Tax=Methanomicrobium sp. W14 TaxID=2817839 RepID=UPI001AE6B24F|nr:hypothetical protein [Methanomicrobium sp. W14]MBP2133971.1 integrase [Methanomicrobium sp. W14]
MNEKHSYPLVNDPSEKGCMKGESILLKQNTRILTPAEYRGLRSEFQNYTHKMIFDGMLFSGARTEEFWRFIKYKRYFDPERCVIHLPEKLVKKSKVKHKARDIFLSNWGLQAMERLYDSEVYEVSRVAWREDLLRAAKKAGIGTNGIMPKMTRKTWESWLIVSFPHMALQIHMSQGHNSITAMNHYLNISFTAEEKFDMKKYVTGFCGETL